MTHQTVYRTLALGLVLVLSACSASDPPAATSAVPDDVRAPDFEVDYREMVGALGLTTDEQAVLRAAFDARLARLTEWLDGPKGDALYAEEKALREAVQSKDLAAIRSISRQDRTQRSRFAALVERTEADIRAALPPEKRVVWDGHQVAEKMLDVMADLNLTGEQVDQVRSNAAGAVDAAARRGEVNPMAAGYMNLETWVERDILTAVQRDAFQPIKQKKPMRTLGF